MGLEKVKQELLNRAREEAGVIAQQARDEAKLIEKSAEKQVKERERVLEEEMERVVELMRRKELASAELELQKKSLGTKNEAIEAVFSEVNRKLKGLGDKSRESHIKSLLGIAMKELDVAVVRCNSRDVRFVSSNGNSKLKVFASDDISGGIIAESGDGKLRVDYSYDTILEQVKSKVLVNVAKILFGK